MERLEESKANYVKSERVLDSRQELKHSAHLQVSGTGPQLDFIYNMAPAVKHLQYPSAVQADNQVNRSPSVYEFVDMRLSPPVGPGLQRVPSVKLRPKSPAPPTRMRAKSQPEAMASVAASRRRLSFFRQSSGRSADEMLDLELQLKRLIAAGGSRENLACLLPPSLSTCPAIGPSSSSASSPSDDGQHRPRVRRGNSDPLQKAANWSTLTPPPVHKSMPNLSPSRCQRASSSDDPHSDSEASTTSSSEAEQFFKPRSRTTSDYVSRSSSFRHSPVKSLRDFGLGRPPRASPVPQRRWVVDDGGGAPRRKPVLRSKSDVSHVTHRIRSHPNLLLMQGGGRQGSRSELERFFDTMGLDAGSWHRVVAPSSPSTSPRYFESVSSVDSGERRSSPVSEDGSCGGFPRDGIRNRDLAEHGPTETSIIEKNARVIKWLFSCRKALAESAS